jgi:ribosomal protein S6
MKAAAALGKIQALIGEHGTINNVEEWGKRRPRLSD